MQLVSQASTYGIFRQLQHGVAPLLHLTPVEDPVEIWTTLQPTRIPVVSSNLTQSWARI